MKVCSHGHAHTTVRCSRCAVERVARWRKQKKENAAKHSAGNRRWWAEHPSYPSYQAMIARCTKESNLSYDRYGGRGITVCDRWLGADGYRNFVADLGEKPGKGYSIERNDGNGNYELGNCKWATAKEQQRNTRLNRLITHQGQTMCMAEWAEKIGMPAEVLRHRLLAKWSIERALTETYHRRNVV